VRALILVPAADAVLKVVHVVPPSSPAHAALLRVACRVDQRQHAQAEEALRLAKVDQVEEVRLAHHGAAHGEEEPLRVPARAVVPIHQLVRVRVRVRVRIRIRVRVRVTVTVRVRVRVRVRASCPDQVVLVAAHVDRPAKVAALEARLEEESAARHELRPRRHEVRRVVHNAVEDQPRLLLPPPPLLRRPEQHVCVGSTRVGQKRASRA